MQDELTKHGLKIYKTMADRKHTFGEKLKEIIIEVFIIVFAVTLSIYLHSWNEHRHEQKEVKEFLRGLRADLTDDIRQLKESRDTIATVDSNFTFAFSVRKGQFSDSVLHHHFYYSLVSTTLNNARYEGFKSSGKLGNIENDSIRDAILVYYQQTTLGIGYHEGLVNTLQQRLLDYQIDKTDISMNEFVTSTKTRALLQISTQNLNNSIYRYDQAIAEVKTIITRIDKEISP